MIGIAVTLCIAVSVIVHGIRSGRHAKAVEDWDNRRDIERAGTLVTFLELVDGWSTLAHHNVRIVAELNRSREAALAVGDEATAAARSRELLEVMVLYGRMDIVDA